MDVRCEKCQTEYELDEARLKPGGVTVKCTNCGHMFRIRKRAVTNVGTPALAQDNTVTRQRSISAKAMPTSAPVSARPVPPSGAQAQPGASEPPAGAPTRAPRVDSIFDDVAQQLGPDEAPTAVDRQWLIRLDNGEQKSCRELATLQQWIIAGVVTRESLISRTGKTWKRLGDVVELGQYFTIADEARANRDRMKPASRPAPLRDGPGTMPGYGAAQAAGGTILPDDDDVEGRTAPRGSPGAVGPGGTRIGAPTPPPLPHLPRGVARTPPGGAGTAPTEPVTMPGPPPVRRRATTPPPPPPRRFSVPATQQPPAISVPQGNRATATWATDGVKPEPPLLGPAGPVAGKLAAIPDEPAFAGRVRIAPGDDTSFRSDQVRAVDDDDDLMLVRRGSRAGMLVLVMALLVMGAAAAVVYVFVIREPRDQVAQPTADAATVATATPDAAAPDAPAVDAAVATPLEAERGELRADLEPRLRTAAQALDGKTDAPSLAMRAHLLAQLAQDLQDRASVTADKAAADALRQEAKQLVLDAATGAQRALKAAGDDAGANLAMAEVLRLQGKPVRDVKRYLDTARAKADPAWARDLALADAMLLVRDGKLEDARAAFAAIDQGDGKLEGSGDVRARLHLALVLAAQNKAGEARPLVDTITAAQPEHAGARALAARLDTLVATTDPLPPEEGSKPDDGKATSKATAKQPGKEPARDTRPRTSATEAGGESYDRLLQRANKLAETSCAQAMDLFAKALEQKPNGVEALTGMGYCHLDQKQFASAFSNFRAALAVSPRYEGALRGIAETYQQMNRKDQAIEAYRAYLEVYPNSVIAKKQLERLGGDTPSPPPSGGGSAPPAPPQAGGSGSAASPPAAPPPSTTPPPAPPPAPPEPAGGSGSG